MLENELEKNNKRKRGRLQKIIKRGLPKNPSEIEIVQYMGLIKEERIRCVLERYFEESVVTEEDRDILRFFADDVGLVVMEEGYYPTSNWGWDYYLNCPFEAEEEATLIMLAAEELKADYLKLERYQEAPKIKVKIVS